MAFDPARIADPEFFAENRLPAHSDHRWFSGRAEAATGTSAFEQCLNGLWKFHYAKNPAQTVAGFQDPDYDTSSWDDIRVPAHIQLEGYDRPQYTNVQYPWDGHEALEPGQVPTRFNPVGSYATTFALDRPLADGERLSVSFHGAESAIAVWLNGTYIGFGADSFTPSEFDLTEAVVDGENTLAAQVFKWSAGSWLEDQDFYRFSGIFRDVVLYRRPAAHLEDLSVRSVVSDDLRTAQVVLRPMVSGGGSVRATLVGHGDLVESGDGELSITLADPHLWSAEDPYRHTLEIEVLGPDGAPTELVVQPVGVRRFGIEDGLLKINGKRVVFRGVNRHEFGLNGRVVTREETEGDVRLLKSIGVNAVRTSHYPNNSYFYDLCDEYGLYVIDEMNLETHGMWDRVAAGELSVDAALPGDRPEWLPALLDRAASMAQRDKNHPSVVMWSCGNESFGGTNLLAVSEWFRALDDRPVHYEGVHWDPRFPETTDVVSQMYTPAGDVEEWLRTHRSKPFILCEYAHAMGNSFGAVDKYLELADREPLFQGGFIWDFADQAIRLRDRHGREYDGYGGDCGEAPHDYEFSANGIVLVDRTPTPKVQEVRYLYQPFRIAVSHAELEIHSRRLFTDTSDLDCVVTLRRDGTVLRETSLAIDVGPEETRSYPLPVVVPSTPGEYAIDVSLRLRHATAWAPAGHEVAWEQQVIVIRPTAPARSRETAPTLVEGFHNIGVRGRHFSALFSRKHGGLVSYRYGLTSDGGRELLQGIPRPNFWHAPTSNERGWGMPFRDGHWLLASRYAEPSPRLERPVATLREDHVEVRYGYLLPTTPHSECDVVHRVYGSGRVEVDLSLRPGAGLPDLPELGMLFTADASLRHLRWYGDGPDECYVDRRRGARLGIYDADVQDQLTPYVRPQEAGSRTGVRWATVTDDRGAGLRFDCDEKMELSALPWTPFEIENAQHPVDLPPIQHTIVRPALMRRGVGGDDSWGATTHPEFLVPQGSDLVFRFAFQGLR
ncbi:MULTISPECIES: glycoside hydrolase family 2 TIM barrel-domain containing protein [unclassified Actinotalea]|uniref:glycoside hydrolase family 2 TIM barrel-domain containing protein n=1 Tax=unclassified Actinotalea TaxID=2638618 RepID=UPI0015F5DE6D|nr:MULTISPECIES: glycoside hydrolase family 2 TIM barrel-domain containing protein [unclassified Actinotalea]